MSELQFFALGGRRVAAALPWSPAVVVEQWQGLRRAMLRAVPEPFTRDEWAYLVSFLAREQLLAVVQQHLGQPAEAGAVQLLARPRSPVGVWLPNNVSMLGPLTFVLLSLTGAEVVLKLGSGGDDLAGAFVDYARSQLGPGPLRDHLHERVLLLRIDRGDPGHAALAARAQARIVFGSNAAGEAIHGLPHPAESVGISFLDHQSEAWVEPEALDEPALRALIAVFSVFGQAGCTSPARVVLLGGDRAAALAVRQQLLTLWPQVVRRDVPEHAASRNVRDAQLLRALGWDATCAPRQAAVLAVGEPHRPTGPTAMALQLTWGSVQEAVATLPGNIQTIGHAVRDPADPRWYDVLAGTAALRWVPLGRMHHFGPVWDGQEFWRQLFTWVEVG